MAPEFVSKFSNLNAVFNSIISYEGFWNLISHLFVSRNLNIGEKEMERKAVKTKWIPMNLWSSDADQCVTCALGPKVILLLLWPSWSPTEKKEAAKCVSKKTVNFPGESKSTHSACSVVVVRTVARQTVDKLDLTDYAVEFLNGKFEIIMWQNLSNLYFLN